MRTLSRIRLALALTWSLNYYEGIDTPTIWQWAWSWRISPMTAWDVAKGLR
jgi:hypothetical protein